MISNLSAVVIVRECLIDHSDNSQIAKITIVLSLDGQQLCVDKQHGVDNISDPSTTRDVRNKVY